MTTKNSAGMRLVENLLKTFFHSPPDMPEKELNTAMKMCVTELVVYILKLEKVIAEHRQTQN